MGSALDPSSTVLVLTPGGLDLISVQALTAAPLAQVAALQAALSAALARLAVLEAKPEEVAHFAGTASLPTAAVGAAFTLRVTAIGPLRAGDRLVPGEQVEVWPTGTMPAGIDMGPPSVAADGSVAIPCRAVLAVAASSAPVPFAVIALR